MTPLLHCYSFHSVKGGVGKSSLSALLAHGLAREMPTTLIDMDLTGTSLGDVMPLEAPRWSGEMNLAVAPDAGFHDRRDTVALIRERGETMPASALVAPPFLNDFLLYATPDWDEDADVHPAALGWRMQGGPDALRVMPSSALPRDLERILPVIYDEEHAAFLEGRLELLLDDMLRHWEEKAPERAVVFDTPPTIPGLSRAVLSLALRLGLRLGQPDKVSLAEDGYIPAVLEAAQVRWTIFLVVTMDVQDLRAANRWLELVRDDEQSLFRVVVNRVAPGLEEGSRVKADIEHRLLGPNPMRAPMSAPVSPAPELDGLDLALLDFKHIVVPDQPDMRFFGDEHVPPALEHLLTELRG